MKQNRKNKGARVAFAVSAAGLACALVAGAVLLSWHSSSNPSPTQGEATYDDGFIEVDWDYWAEINPDIVGWVTVDGTSINYPIVAASSDEPNFYLKHDVYGNYNSYGVPYLDAECKEGMESDNVVILGHHMNDDSMFSDFANYSDPAYAQEHSVIRLQTPEKKLTLTVRAVDVISGSSLTKRTSFLDISDYLSWYTECLEDADVVLDAVHSPSQNFTFVTCSYNVFRNGRTLVYASTQDEVVIVDDMGEVGQNASADLAPLSLS